jgi:hypothetical protein
VKEHINGQIAGGQDELGKKPSRRIIFVQDGEHPSVKQRLGHVIAAGAKVADPQRRQGKLSSPIHGLSSVNFRHELGGER